MTLRKIPDAWWPSEGREGLALPMWVNDKWVVHLTTLADSEAEITQITLKNGDVIEVEAPARTVAAWLTGAMTGTEYTRRATSLPPENGGQQ